MAVKDPTPYIWWLVSRASGIVALLLITLTVIVGLTMATKLLRRPGLTRKLVRAHEHLALVALGAISVHGLALLGDPWLRPGLSGLTVPFAMSYRPLFTGLGVIAGYLAALLGLSFYARRRIGVRLWRRLHRATVLVWALGVVHTLGAGSDAATQWLRALVLLPAIPIVYLTALRVFSSPRKPPARTTAKDQAPADTCRGGMAQRAGRRPAIAPRTLAEEGTR